MFCQIWNCGRISHESYQPGGQPPPAPSALACPEGVVMTMEGPKVRLAPTVHPHTATAVHNNEYTRFLPPPLANIGSCRVVLEALLQACSASKRERKYVFCKSSSSRDFRGFKPRSRSLSGEADKGHKRRASNTRFVPFLGGKRDLRPSAGVVFSRSVEGVALCLERMRV